MTDSNLDAPQCPQCRSSKTHQPNLLAYATCEYCQNTFYPTTYDELYTHLKNTQTITLSAFKNPLTIRELDTDSPNDRFTLYLDGTHGAEYKLVINTDHTGKLYRRKSGSERNQFGSHWTNPKDTWPTNK